MKKEKKESIKKDYNYICQGYGDKFPSFKLTIHHVQAKRYRLATSREFLIPYCHDCHNKVEEDYRRAEKNITYCMPFTI